MKSPFLSKTNIFGASLIVLSALEGTIGILRPVIGENAVAITLFVCGFAGILLRQVTKEPVQSLKDVVKTSLK